MELVITNLYVFGMAVVLALLEIQIEGKHGWAEKLPTWRPASQTLFSKLPQEVLRRLTGYHLAMFGLLLAMFHFPFFAGATFSLQAEMQILSLFFMFAITWDFLWFILNPHYSLTKFQAKYIPWHRYWLWGVPVEYFIGIGASLLVMLPIYGQATFSWWIWNVLLFIFQSGLVIALTRRRPIRVGQEPGLTAE